MITSVLGIAYRLSSANRSRMVASITSVTVAMTLVLSMSLLLMNMDRSYKQQLTDVFGNVDMIVTPPKDSFGQLTYFDQLAQQHILNTSGIHTASFVLMNPIEGEQLFLIGLQNDELAKVRYNFNEDLTGDEVVITNTLAQRLDVKQGEFVTLPLIHIEQKKWLVKEIIEDVNVTSFPDLVYMNLSALQDVSGLEEKVTGAMLDINSSSEPLSLVRLLERTIESPIAYQLVTESDLAKQNAEGLRSISFIVITASLIASLAIVLSNFNLMLQSIVLPMIVLHSNGANKKQLFSIILYQLAAVIGIGSVVGVVIAALLSMSSSALLERIFSISSVETYMDWGSLLFYMVIYGALLFILLLPLLARGFSQLPLQHRNMVKEKERGLSKPIQNFSWLLLSGSVILIISILFFSGPVLLYLLAGIMFACGIWLLLPTIFHHWLSFKINSIIRKKQKEKIIAFQYLSLYFKQNVLIIMAIAISINVPVIGFTVFDTAKKANINIVNEEFVADIHLYSSSITVALPEHAASDVSQIEGIKTVIPISQDDWASVINVKAVEEEQRYVNLYYKKSDLQQLAGKGLLPALPTDLSNIVVLTKDYAKELDVVVGDQLLLLDPEHDDQQLGNLEVAAIVEGYLPGSMSIDKIAYVDANQSIIGADQASPAGSRAREWNTLLLYIENESREAIFEELEAYASFYTNVRFGDKQQALSSMEEFANQRFIFLYSIVAVTLLVSAIGIFYTMKAFVYQRRKEFAILFSMGLTFNQVRRMLALQICWFCFIASLTGVVTSIALSGALLLAMESPMISISWIFICSIVLGLIGFGYMLSWVLSRDLRSASIPQLMKNV